MVKNDPLELVVLAVLADGPGYGYAITKQVAARSDGAMRLSPGVLYPLLSLLEKQGLITSSWDEVKSDRDAGEPWVDASGESRGRRRKWYRLSAKGRKRLAQRIEAHRAYQRMIESFLPGGTARPAGGEGAA
jgi:PadR family transcriptional regulator PadR